MNCVIRISPHGRYDIISTRYVSEARKMAYPARIANLAVLGEQISVGNYHPNYTASCLINRNISAILSGYAYVFNAENGLNDLQAFSKTEAEQVVINLIQTAGGKL